MRALAIGILVLTVLCACKAKNPNDIDASAFEAVAGMAEQEMNAPVAAILDLLRGSGSAQVPLDSLVITSGPAPEPVGWWLVQKGWIANAGFVLANRPVFTLSDAATAMLAQPDEPWFTVTQAQGAKPAADCRSPQAMTAGGCLVRMTLQPALTDAGKRVLGPKTLVPVDVQTAVRAGSEDWDVDQLETADGATFYDRAVTAILGDPTARAAGALAARDRLGQQLRISRGDIPLRDPPPPAPNYIEPPPPVAPVDTSDPRAALGLGVPR